MADMSWLLTMKILIIIKLIYVLSSLPASSKRKKENKSLTAVVTTDRGTSERHSCQRDRTHASCDACVTLSTAFGPNLATPAGYVRAIFHKNDQVKQAGKLTTEE